jgi:hypothetical protein
MNLVVANLKARVVSTLSNRGPLKFSNLARTLRSRDEKRLDNVLQDLRRTGQIHFINPTAGWDIGKGKVYTPMQRSF